jgi:hypothetical protein
VTVSFEIDTAKFGSLLSDPNSVMLYAPLLYVYKVANKYPSNTTSAYENLIAATCFGSF